MKIKEKFIDTIQNKNVMMSVLTISFMLGVIAYFNNLGIFFAFLVTTVTVVLSFIRYIPRRIAILLIFMFYAGFFNSDLRIKNFDDVSLFAPQEVEIIGQIVNIPEINAKNCKFEMSVKTLNSSNIKGKVLVWLNDEQRRFDDYKIGDIYKIKGNLHLPLSSTNPSQFDYSKFLRNKKIHSIIYPKPENCVQIGINNSVNWKFLRNLNDLRHKIIDVHSEFLKSPNLQVLGGIVFGDDAVSPPEYVKDSFINSGLLHILAASGMNVAFIWGFWFYFMQKARIGYRKTLVSGIFVIILYMFMTGLGASVVRAGLMLIAVLIGKLIDRDTHSVSLLSFVALLMLIYNPAYLNDVGFQMSFLATFGILTTGQTLHERLKDCKLPNVIKGDVAIPIIAQAWVAPVQMFYFNTFAPYAVLANIAIIPFLCVVSFGGFTSSILAMFYPYTKYLCLAVDFIVNIFISVILKISDFFSAMDFSLIITSKPLVIQLLIYYTIISLITLAIKYGFGRKILMSTLILLTLLILSNIRIHIPNLEIICFDVQNADCFLVKTPKNDYYVIDTGKFPYTGKNSQASMIIGKYLKDRGIHKIKGLIITHYDNDHAGGGAYLIQNFDVERIYLSDKNAKSVTAISVLNAIDFTNSDYKIADTKEIIDESKNFKITLLRAVTEKDENENSIQALVSFKDFDMLFTGDAGIIGFNSIKENLPSNVEVLKVGHHGAKESTSISMLETINPQTAIISTGVNYFGHPSQQTLENLNRKQVKIFRTDYDGALKITTNGGDFGVQTYSQSKRNFSKSLSKFHCR